jgi:hypothetical protein
MARNLTGTYFENCSCHMVRPCTTSGMSMPADQDRCQVVLAFHVESGEVDGVDVSGKRWSSWATPRRSWPTQRAFPALHLGGMSSALSRSQRASAGVAAADRGRVCHHNQTQPEAGAQSG